MRYRYRDAAENGNYRKVRMYYEETKYGFIYGDASITRAASEEKVGWVILDLETSKFFGHESIKIYVTKTGKVRIYSKAGEWKPPKS